MSGRRYIVNPLVSAWCQLEGHTSGHTSGPFSRLKPKIIHYRNYKRFGEQKFIDDVKNADFSFETDDPNENYSALTSTFSLIVEKHAPLKKCLSQWRLW